MDAARARKGLAVYFAVLAVSSGTIQWFLLRSPGWPTGLVLALMWCPALASLVARLVLREGPGDVSFRPGRGAGRWLLLAWLFPVAVGLLGYGVGWVTGLAPLVAPDGRLAGAWPPAARLAAGIGSQLTLGTAFGLVFAAGEEIGWRGYMLTRLVQAGLPRPVLLGALAWAAWHVPLIVSGQYATGGNPLVSIPLFVVDIAAISYLMARMRLETGSVWPAVLLHASWNAVIQGVFDRWTPGRPDWVGESGLLTVAANVLLVLLLVRGRWRVRVRPADAEAPEVAGLAAL